MSRNLALTAGRKQSNCSFCGRSFIHPKSSPGVFCSLACKGEYQRLAKPVTREWLEEMYVSRGMDCTQIAKIVNRDPKSVWNWLKDFGIETRKRGFASSATWMKRGGVSPFRGRKHKPETRLRLREIALADGRVPFDPEVGPPYRGKSGAEIPSWKGGITPQRQAFYSTLEWKAVVKSVWKRDNATCQLCRRRKKDDRSIGFDIHHIVGFDCVELRSVVSNLVLLCEPCHYWVHSSKNVNRLFIA